MSVSSAAESRAPLSPAEAAKKTEPVAPLSPAEAAAGKTREPAAPSSPVDGSAGPRSEISAPLSPAELAAKEQAAEGSLDAAGDVSSMKFKEPPPKTIGEGYEKRTLRRLTPEEKAARRAKWNFVMGCIGVVLLLVVAAILMQM